MAGMPFSYAKETFCDELERSTARTYTGLFHIISVLKIDVFQKKNNTFKGVIIFHRVVFARTEKRSIRENFDRWTNEPVDEIIGFHIFRIGQIVEDVQIIVQVIFFVFNDELPQKTYRISHRNRKFEDARATEWFAGSVG